MISLPHQPDAARAQAALKTVEAILNEPAPHVKDMKPGQGPAFLGRHRILHGLLLYALQGPGPKVAQELRAGVAAFAEALDQGHAPHARDVWSNVLASLACGDRSTAQLIATIPEDLWVEPKNLSLYPVMIQTKAVFSLLRQEEPESTRWVETSHAIAFEERMTQAQQLEAEEIRNTHRLLEAIHTRNAATFNSWLEKRLQVRAVSFAGNGRNSPLGFVDLDALGLCALAQDRGMVATVRHPSLPYDLAKG